MCIIMSVCVLLYWSQLIEIAVHTVKYPARLVNFFMLVNRLAILSLYRPTQPGHASMSVTGTVGDCSCC